MIDIIEFVFGLSATILLGVVCTFFVYCNSIKEEIWEETYKVLGIKED